nr:MAG: structural polyprotein [Crogonang virus 22]
MCSLMVVLNQGVRHCPRMLREQRIVMYPPVLICTNWEEEAETLNYWLTCVTELAYGMIKFEVNTQMTCTSGSGIPSPAVDACIRSEDHSSTSTTFTVVVDQVPTVPDLEECHVDTSLESITIALKELYATEGCTCKECTLGVEYDQRLFEKIMRNFLLGHVPNGLRTHVLHRSKLFHGRRQIFYRYMLKFCAPNATAQSGWLYSSINALKDFFTIRVETSIASSTIAAVKGVVETPIQVNAGFDLSGLFPDLADPNVKQKAIAIGFAIVLMLNVKFSSDPIVRIITVMFAGYAAYTVMPQEWKSRIAGFLVPSAQSSIMDYAELIFEGCSLGLFGSKIKMSSMAEFTRSIKDVDTACKSTTSFFRIVKDWVVRVATLICKDIGIQCDLLLDPHKRFIDDTFKLIIDTRNMVASGDVIGRDLEHLMVAKSEVYGLIAKLPYTNETIRVKEVLTRLHKDLEDLIGLIENMGYSGGDRSAPLVLYIQGASGCGKSAIMKLLASELIVMFLKDREIEDYKRNSSAYQYTYLQNSEYFEGYSSAKSIAFMVNDIFTSIEQPGSGFAPTFIEMVGDNKCPLNQAFATKGKVFFTSPLMLIAGNRASFPDSLLKSVANPEAVRRRFDLSFAMSVVDESVRMPQTFKSEIIGHEKDPAFTGKVNKFTVKGTDHLRFHQLDIDSAKIYGPPLTYEELVSRLRDIIKENRALDGAKRGSVNKSVEAAIAKDMKRRMEERSTMTEHRGPRAMYKEDEDPPKAPVAQSRTFDRDLVARHLSSGLCPLRKYLKMYVLACKLCGRERYNAGGKPYISADNPINLAIKRMHIRAIASLAEWDASDEQLTDAVLTDFSHVPNEVRVLMLDKCMASWNEYDKYKLDSEFWTRQNIVFGLLHGVALCAEVYVIYKLLSFAASYFFGGSDKPEKPKQLCAVAQSTGLDGSVIRKVCGNQYKLFVGGSSSLTYKSICVVTFVYDHVAFTTKHTFDNLAEVFKENKDVYIELVPITGYKNNLSTKIFYRDLKLDHTMDHKDLTFFKVPESSMAKHANISKFFIRSRSDGLKFIKSKVVTRVSIARFGQDDPIFEASTMQFAGVHKYMNGSHLIGVGESFRIDSETRVGDCGMTAFWTDPARCYVKDSTGNINLPYVVYVHTSDDGCGRGMGVVVVAEDLDAVKGRWPDSKISTHVERLNSGVQIARDVFGVAQTTPFITEGPFLSLEQAPGFELHHVVLGTTDDIQPFVTSGITRSELYGVFPLEKKPARLKPFMHNGLCIDPMADARSAYGSNTGRLFDHAIINTIANVSANHVLSKRTIPVKPGVLSHEEVVMGTGCIRGYNNSTSCGPILRNVFKSAGLPVKGKTAFMQDDYEKRMEHENFPKFIKLVESYIDILRGGDRMPCLYADNLKDETRPIEKTTTRLFSAPDAAATHIFKMYFGSFLNYLQDGRITNSFAVGVNPFSDEWKDVYNHLSAAGDNNLFADFGKFDKRLPLAFMSCFMVWCRQYYGTHDPESNSIRELLFQDVLQSVHLTYVDGVAVVYAWDHGNCSGNYLTTHVNNVGNMCLTLYCMLDLSSPPGAKLVNSTAIVTHLMDNCRFLFYGDDQVVSIGSDFVHINFHNMKERVETLIGLEYTDESKGKSEDVDPHRRLVDGQFIGRGFAPETVRGQSKVLAPLRLVSLRNSIQWYRNTRSIPNLKRLVDMTALELSMHGKRVFDDHMKIITPASMDKLNYKSVYTDYDLALETIADLPELLATSYRPMGLDDFEVEENL